MKISPNRWLVALCLAPVLASPAWAGIASTFDTGLEGWTGVDGSVAYVANGGNPGGFLAQSDTDNANMAVLAPAKFLGNLSSYLGGTVSFDGLNLSGDTPDYPGFGTVTITSPTAVASFVITGNVTGYPPADGTWHPYSALLSPAAWSGDLAGALGNVTSIAVQLEFHNGIVETAGFDNFQISAVPEPAQAWLLLAGALALVPTVVRRRAAVARIKP